MKKLNNKGFTLIELLAVVVILAVVMGIAMTSVLTAMNNSRKGSLQDSAKSVSQAMQTKYSEALVTNSTNDVFGDVLKSDGTTTKGYNFTKKGFFALNSGLKDDLNLSPSTYVLADNSSAMTPTADNKLDASTSFVYYDGERFTVCLMAKRAGSYFVANAASNKTVILGGTTVSFKEATADTDAMWSCSTDGEYSWK